MRATLAGFYIRTEDELAVQSNTAGRSVYENIPASQRRGAEAEFQSDWSHGFSSRARLHLHSGTDAAVLQHLHQRSLRAGGGRCRASNSGGAGRLAVRRGDLASCAGGILGYARGHRPRADLRQRRRTARPRAVTGWRTCSAGIEQQRSLWHFTEALRLDNLANRSYVGSVIVNETNSRYFEPEPGRTVYLMVSAVASLTTEEPCYLKPRRARLPPRPHHEVAALRARRSGRPAAGDAVLRDLSGAAGPDPRAAQSGGAARAVADRQQRRCRRWTGQPRLGVPVAGIRKFIAVGLNYADHAAEAGLRFRPSRCMFTKAISCLNGPNDDIVLPKGSLKSDWEVELGVVIGTRRPLCRRGTRRSSTWPATAWSTTSASANTRSSAAAPGTRARVAILSGRSAHGW